MKISCDNKDSGVKINPSPPVIKKLWGGGVYIEYFQTLAGAL